MQVKKTGSGNKATGTMKKGSKKKSDRPMNIRCVSKIFAVQMGERLALIGQVARTSAEIPDRMREYGVEGRVVSIVEGVVVLEVGVTMRKVSGIRVSALIVLPAGGDATPKMLMPITKLTKHIKHEWLKGIGCQPSGLGGDAVEVPDNTSRLLAQHLELHIRGWAWNFGAEFWNGLCVVGPMAFANWWMSVTDWDNGVGDADVCQKLIYGFSDWIRGRLTGCQRIIVQTHATEGDGDHHEAGSEHFTTMVCDLVGAPGVRYYD